MTSPVIPEHVRAGIHAGFVVQVVVFCDRCRTEHRADYLGETKEVRFAAAWRHLGEQGWRCDADGDVCPDCVNDRPRVTDRATRLEQFRPATDQFGVQLYLHSCSLQMVPLLPDEVVWPCPVCDGDRTAWTPLHVREESR